MMASLRAFPVLYARDVELVAGFYATLGFVEHFRLPGADGAAGFIAMRREGGAELAVTTEDSPRMLAGVEPGPGPRHELFVYVEDVDSAAAGVEAAGGPGPQAPPGKPGGGGGGVGAGPGGEGV